MQQFVAVRINDICMQNITIDIELNVFMFEEHEGQM